MATADSVAIRSQATYNRALIGIAVSLAILNSLVTWFAYDGIRSNTLIAIVYGLYAVQPILFGIWTALGAGSIIKRLPLATPCLFLIFIAPGYVPEVFADIRPNEFYLMIAMGFTVFITATLLFLVFRRFTRFRIQFLECEPATGIAFSIKELLFLVTLYAVALGMATQLKFKTSPPPTNLVFGFGFFLRILVIGGSILAGAVVPTTAIPLCILHGRPTRGAILLALTLWAAITIAIILFFLHERDFFVELIVPLLGAQLAAATIGAIIAIWLRYNGLRLVRPPRLATQPAPSEP